MTLDLSTRCSANGQIGRSEASKQMEDFAGRAAATDHTLLLRGETGVGKDYLAERIHAIGRADHSFVPVDCGGLSETLSEADLFGHTPGAFTDAQSAKTGLVDIATKGTLFFNEIGNMKPSMQARFLRILEKRSYRRVGGTKEMAVETRIIAATNSNLEEDVRQGRMRRDLYHRLNVIPFIVPPLRDRLDDIPDLVEHFLRQEGYPSKDFTPEAVATMMGYNWPGNVRELKNMVIGSAFFSAEEEHILPEHVRPFLCGVGEQELYLAGLGNYSFPTLDELQTKYIREVLSRCKGNVQRAASMAGITKPTMYAKIDKLRLKDWVDSLRRSRQVDQAD